MPISKNNVVDAVLRGAAAANKTYEDWTSGTWLTDAGDEGLLVAEIAKALRKKQNRGESLLLQAPFEEIRFWSGAARPPGRPRAVLRGNRRADIAVFDERGRTTHVIEAKRFWQRGRCFYDIKRLRALLNVCARHKNGSLRHGYLAFLIAESGSTPKAARSCVKRRAQCIKDDVRTRFQLKKSDVEFHLGNMARYPREYNEDGEWMVGAVCMVFSN